MEQTILPDEREDIAWNLKRLADTGAADLVLTTGGTGLSPRDVTPQATRDIVDYEVPGLGGRHAGRDPRRRPHGDPVAAGRGRVRSGRSS